MSQKNQAANFITESIDDVKVKTSGKVRGQRPESPIYLFDGNLKRNLLRKKSQSKKVQILIDQTYRTFWSTAATLSARLGLTKIVREPISVKLLIFTIELPLSFIEV